MLLNALRARPPNSSDDKLLAAMIRQAPSDLGALAGQTGGLLRVTLKTDR
jgi:hypothetical protein